MDKNKKWKPIPGYSLYACNKLGQIKNKKTGHILRQKVDKKGYLSIALRKDSSYKTLCVHRLVGETFIGPLPEDKQTNHIDGNKQNAAASNLEYITCSENALHAFDMGLRVAMKGINHPLSKLNNFNVRTICDMLSSGKFSQREIGDVFGVASHTISDINTRTAWTHITDDYCWTPMPSKGVTEHDVPKIREMLKEGTSGVEIAKMFNITKAAVSAIKSRKNWGWVK